MMSLTIFAADKPGKGNKIEQIIIKNNRQEATKMNGTHEAGDQQINKWSVLVVNDNK